MIDVIVYKLTRKKRQDFFKIRIKNSPGKINFHSKIYTMISIGIPKNKF
jgi:hypothetical protein